MTKTYRELTGKEKRQIKKLVVSKCAAEARRKQTAARVRKHREKKRQQDAM